MLLLKRGDREIKLVYGTTPQDHRAMKNMECRMKNLIKA